MLAGLTGRDVELSIVVATVTDDMIVEVIAVEVPTAERGDMVAVLVAETLEAKVEDIKLGRDEANETVVA